MKIIHTIDDDVVVGYLELTSQQGVIRGPFGNIIGFYNYEKDLTTDERGIFYLTGNKTIQLLLKYVEKLNETGVDIHFAEYEKINKFSENIK